MKSATVEEQGDADLTRRQLGKIILVTVLSALLVSSDVLAGSIYQPDTKMNGPVRQVTCSKTDITKDGSGGWVEGDPFVLYTAAYNEQGMVTEIVQQLAKGIPPVKSVFTYGKDGKLLRQDGYQMVGDSLITFDSVTVDYDSTGNPQETVITAGDQEYKASFTYDAQGRLVETTSLQNKTVYEYDDQGRNTKAISTTRQDDLSYTVITYIAYNDQGQITSTSYTVVDGAKQVFVKIATVNGQNQLVESLSYEVNPGSLEVPVEEIGATYLGDLLLGRIPDSRYTYIYEYDAYGNWVKCTVMGYSSSAQPEMHPIEVRKRDIIYR